MSDLPRPLPAADAAAAAPPVAHVQVWANGHLAAHDGAVPEAVGYVRLSIAQEVCDAGDELLRSLGEYVRQTMSGNPEWSEGIERLGKALLAARRAGVLRPKAAMQFERGSR